MVLNELGQKISAALAKVQNAEVVDDALIDACLKDISTALLQADVNVRQVRQKAHLQISAVLERGYKLVMRDSPHRRFCCVHECDSEYITLNL